ncbi:MAG: hypothetical protein CMH98_13875 [Oceanospirillaceae bacterium]|nr:hypothetical protein [Oceanospirillaceae bacterium]
MVTTAKTTAAATKNTDTDTATTDEKIIGLQVNNQTGYSQGLPIASGNRKLHITPGFKHAPGEYTEVADNRRAGAEQILNTRGIAYEWVTQTVIDEQKKEAAEAKKAAQEEAKKAADAGKKE